MHAALNLFLTISRVIIKVVDFFEFSGAIRRSAITWRVGTKKNNNFHTNPNSVRNLQLRVIFSSVRLNPNIWLSGCIIFKFILNCCSILPTEGTVGEFRSMEYYHSVLKRLSVRTRPPESILTDPCANSLKIMRPIMHARPWCASCASHALALWGISIIKTNYMP